MKRWLIPLIPLLTLALLAPAGIAQSQTPAPAGVSVPPGYSLATFATGLDFPTGITFGAGAVWVSEAGIGSSPKVKELAPDGTVATILDAAQLPAGRLPAGRLLSPLIDVTYHDGWLWITHLQVGVNGWHVGAISKFRPDNAVATFTTVITNLPSSGDHHTDEIAFGGDGRAYVSIGSATNSSVVGPDNFFITGWLGNFPTFRDFPARSVVLSGIEYTTANPLTADPDDTAVTAPFRPFNSGPVPANTVVAGASPASPQEGIIAGVGSVYSFDPSVASPASTLRLEMWGLRNPFGVGLDPLHPGTLLVTNNGADIRSVPRDGTLAVVEPRPIANDFDDLFVASAGGGVEFAGWPDFFHDPQTGAVLPVTDPLFCDAAPEPAIPCPDLVFHARFRKSLTVQPAFAQFELHSSANKFDVSTARSFGSVGDLFVAETGSFVPITGAQQFTGYKVVRVDRGSGRVTDFIVNQGDTAEELFDPASFNKPIDVKFRDEVMFIVDFGVFEPGLNLMQPRTGKVWVVTRGMPAP